jgi:branched-chain amino acid transport system permease protein
MRLLSDLIQVAGGGDMSTAARRKQMLAMAALYLLLAALLGALSGGYWRINLTAAYAVMLALMGTNLLFGQLGLVSLCQFALVGVGGWVTLRLGHGTSIPFELSMLAGGLVAAAIGVLWGLPALRLRGIYLALVTLMLAGAFQTLIGSWNFPAGGEGFLGTAGMEGHPRVLLNRPVLADSDLAYFFYVALVGLIGLIIVELHRYSKPGRSWALIRKDPRLAATSGVSILRYQAWAFALAGFLAGIGGGLLAGVYRQLDARAFGASESVVLFAASVLGGTTNWVGTVVGALLMRIVPLILDEFGTSAAVGTAIFGLALMIAIINGPEGIAGLFDQLFDRTARKAKQ